MKKNMLWISLLLLGFALNTFGQPRYPSRFRGERLQREHFLGIPDLTDEQIEQIKDIQIAHLKDIQPIQNDLKINRATLNALLTEYEPDTTEINKLIERNSQLSAEIQKKNVAYKFRVRNLLTDDQKVYFDNRMHDRRHGLREGFRMNRRFGGW